MVRTNIRSGQIKDDTILIDDLSDFATIKRATGLVVDINAGRIRNNNTIVNQSAQTVTVTNSTTSYVELDSSGVVSSNTSGFTSSRTPLAIIVASGGNVSSVTDSRTWLQQSATISDYNRLVDNLMELAFQMQVSNSLSVLKFTDGFSDEYTDETGIDTAGSTNQLYDSVNKLYSPSVTANGIDSFVKLLVQNNITGSTGVSKAIFFDGTGDYLSLATSTDWNFGTGDFTVEAWVKFSVISGTNEYEILDRNSEADYTFSYSNNTTALRWYASSSIKLSASFSPVTNRWYHLVVVRSSGTLKIYADGVEKGSVSDATNYSSSNAINIARRSNNANYLNGFIKNFRVSNSARYTAAFTPSQTAFTADSNTKLLILAEESIGAVSFTDSETTPKTITTNGDSILQFTNDYRNANFLDTETTAKTISTVNDAKIIPYMMSNTAGYFDGASYVQVPDSNDWDFGTGDFTVDFWWMATKTSQEHGWIGNGYIAGFGFYMSAANNITLYLMGTLKSTTTFNYTIFQWNHIAVVRTSGTLKLFVNGKQLGSDVSSTENITGSTNDLRVGSDPQLADFTNGWLKEVRISNNARWTTTFTPSTSEYSSDSNTKLLLHFDTPSTKPLSPALTFDGTGDYLSLVDSPDWDFGTGDFTIECFIRFNSVSNTDFFDRNQGTDYALWYSSSTLLWQAGGSNIKSESWTPVTNRWYHVAVCRSGTSLRMFIDGLQVGTATTNSTNLTYTHGITIGADAVGANALNGWIKQLRVSNSARYTASFTPSQTAFTADANTVLLVLATENNGAVSFTDSETTPKTITTNGDTIIQYIEDYRNIIFIDSGNIGQKAYGSLGTRPKIDFIVPFGTGTGVFDGTGDYLTIPDSADWDFGTGDFTIDFLVKFLSTSGTLSFFEIGTYNSSGIYAYYTGGTFFVHVNNGSSTTSFSLTPLTGVWYHIAIVRSSSTLKYYINGVSKASVSNSSNITGSTQGVVVAALQTGGFGNYFNGIIEEFRISNNARYTATFNPAIAEYVVGTPTNMTLKSNVQTASAVPTTARLVIAEEDVDAITINTDLLADVSRDGGTTFTTATLALEGPSISPRKIYTASVDLSGQPSGTSMKYKIRTANTKSLKIHASALSWK